MLVTTLILVAVALLIVLLLLRGGSVEPKVWAKRHQDAEAAEADLKSMMPEGVEPPPVHGTQPAENPDSRKPDPPG